MSRERSGVGAAVVDGVLYAVGGRDHMDNTTSVERYDEAANSWSEVAPLNKRRDSLGVAVVDGVMYAIGGELEGNTLSCVERYDADADKWTEVASMGSKRKWVAAAGSGFAKGPLTLRELRNAGCSALQLQTARGCSTAELIAAGFAQADVPLANVAGRNWHYKDNTGTDYGPFAWEQIEAWYNGGHLQPALQIHAAGGLEYFSLSVVAAVAKKDAEAPIKQNV